MVIIKWKKSIQQEEEDLKTFSTPFAIMKAGEWQSNNLVKIHGQFCTANMRENKTNEKAQRRYAAPLHKEPYNVVCLLKLIVPQTNHNLNKI